MQDNIQPQVPVREHTFGPGPASRRQRRKAAKDTGHFKRKKPQRSITRVKVR